MESKEDPDAWKVAPLIYLSLDLTTFGCSSIGLYGAIQMLLLLLLLLNMITLSTLPEPEIDLTMTLKTIERL